MGKLAYYFWGRGEGEGLTWGQGLVLGQGCGRRAHFGGWDYLGRRAFLGGGVV